MCGNGGAEIVVTPSTVFWKATSSQSASKVQ